MIFVGILSGPDKDFGLSIDIASIRLFVVSRANTPVQIGQIS